MRIALRLFTVALFVGALTLAVSQTNGVKADAFTDVGCATGNYSCLYTNGGGIPTPYYPGYGYAYGQVDPFAAVGCANGDYNCLASKTGGYYAAPGVDPFAAAGCPEGNYSCLYGQAGVSGITVSPSYAYPYYVAPAAPAPANNGPLYVTTPLPSNP